ncbi:MAG TPA: DNA primase [Beijerinckiaceae bacterium]|nr:DNA primase [Beijerinckiaceae bacterium]
MKFSSAFLDELRARVPVSEVVRSRVKLRKQGREWAGLSPFNQEKTPSFFVNDQKGFYHDFSSGKHGDAFTFLMETQGLSFPEAVEHVANLAGVPLPRPDPAARSEEERKRTLYDVLELACSFFERALSGSAGGVAREYLQQRGISSATASEFRIGYAPEGRESLRSFLLERGVPENDLIKAGLVITPEDGRSSYDRFRGRLMIPIQDLKGRVIGFGGRTLAPDGKPKYLNSPETELFHKGDIVFNAHRARPAAHELRTVVVVEGYLDAIAVFQAGMKAVVASLGTAFTEGQIAALWRLAEEPVVCFDGDKAGQAAAYRAVDRILPVLRVGSSFKFAFLPEGHDPDDLIRTSRLSAFTNVLGSARELWQVLWDRETRSIRPESPDQRAVLETRFDDLTGSIKDRAVSKAYRFKARMYLANLFWQVDRLSKSGVKLPLSGIATSELVLAEKPTRLVRIETLFLGMLVRYPEIAEDHLERIVGLNLRGIWKGAKYSEFLKDCIRILTDFDDLAPSVFYRQLHPSFSAVLEHVHGPETKMGSELLRRLPVLACDPPQSFVLDVFCHFMEMLEVRDLEDEIEELLKIIPIDEDLLRGLQEEFFSRKDRILAMEHRLAEEGSDIRNSHQNGQRKAA